MIQIFRVTVDSTVITDEVPSCNITKVINRFYDVATFVTGEYLIAKSDILIEYGDDTFNGFILSVTKTDNGLYSIECRSNGGKLTEPFVSSKHIGVDNASTSHSLCALYSSEAGVTINITAIDLDFGGDYERKGTMLNALTSIANSTGAEYWCSDSGIQIQPNKPITSMGREIKDSDIFDFVPFNRTIEHHGVKTVIVGNKSIANATTPTTAVSCTAKVDGCTNLAMIRVIPHDAYEYAEGLNSIVVVKTPMNKKGVINTSSYYTLDADIVSISTVKVNNATVSDYTFVDNKIIFTSPKRGLILVDYIGWGISASVNHKMVGEDRICSFSVYYGECNVFNYDGILTCNDPDKPGDPSTTENECGGVLVEIPNDTNYVKGFYFYAMNETPTIYFYYDTTRVSMSVTQTTEAIARLENAVLSTYDGSPQPENVRHKFRTTSVSVAGVTSHGNNISYTSDSEYLYLDEEYKDVRVSYTTSAKKIFVQGDDIPDESVYMVIGGPQNDDLCEYALDGGDDEQNGVSCELGQDVVVNIVDICGFTLESAINRQVPVLDPNNSQTLHTVDDFGAITITNVLNGVYYIYLDTIWENAYIKMTSHAT